MANLTNSAKLIEEMEKKINASDVWAAGKSNDYNDLDNKPTIPTVNSKKVKFQKNWTQFTEITDNSSSDQTVNIQLTAADVWLWNVNNTSDADKPVSNATQTALNAKADASTTYTKAEVDSAISSAVSSVYKYKWSKANYDALPSSWNITWDVWNVEAAHTTAPVFPAWSNLAWDGNAWDVLGWTVDLSWYVDTSTNQTIWWTKTFSTSPVVPSKTTSASNTWTAIATEAQVYLKANTSDVLTKTNTTSFTPSDDYHPATKKYVDDNKWTNIVYCTQSEYDLLPSSKTSDGKVYMIYTTS